MTKVKLIATATFGMEAVVADEVKRLGYTDLSVENGKVIFEADISAIARANLWLRAADRVRLVVGEFKAVTFDQLFERTKTLLWHEWIEQDGEFPVEGKSVKSTLFSISDCQAIVKKAVVESLKNSYKTSWFAETGALYRIEVSILKDQVTLTIDTSGTGLHRRGYRDWIGVAPLKETMAAGLIYLSRWRNDRPLVDPFCGSGTIPIEAALIGKNIAPGMNREFAAEDWPAIPREIWHNARAETHGLANFAQKVEILGTDIDGEIIKIAERNAEEADLAADIKFRRVAIKDLHLASDYGVLIANPPYGERISEQSEVDQIYRVLGEKYRAYRTWSYFILTANEQFEKFFGAQASKKRKLYNGNIKVDYYQYYGPLPSFKKLGSGGEN